MPIFGREVIVDRVVPDDLGSADQTLGISGSNTWHAPIRRSFLPPSSSPRLHIFDIGYMGISAFVGYHLGALVVLG